MTTPIATTDIRRRWPILYYHPADVDAVIGVQRRLPLFAEMEALEWEDVERRTVRLARVDEDGEIVVGPTLRLDMSPVSRAVRERTYREGGWE